MSICDERQAPKNERDTKTILNIELLFARVVLIYVRAHEEKSIAADAVVV